VSNISSEWPSFCEVLIGKGREVMKFVNLILIGAVIKTCDGQGTQLGRPNMLTATLIRILSTREPAMFGQNRAQTLTAIGTGQAIESFLTALAPTLTYTFYSLNKEGAFFMDPGQYWTQVLLVDFRENVSLTYMYVNFNYKTVLISGDSTATSSYF
jgi:hypothetical protein